MNSRFPHFQQYVDFATRGENMLDLHQHQRGIRGSAATPHLGFSDHLSVMLIPAYKPLITYGGGHCVAGGGLA